MTPNYLFATQPNERAYKSGDLAQYSSDGSILFCGRKDHQIKIRGYRIELGDIESFINECHAVTACVVAPIIKNVGDKNMTTGIAVYVVLEHAEQAVLDAIKKEVADGLPQHMIPSKWSVLKSLPLTQNGKINRKKLAFAKCILPTMPSSDTDVPSAMTMTANEILLAEHWLRILPRDKAELVTMKEKLSPHDNFFQLGGHSLLIMQLMTGLAQQGFSLNARDALTHPVLTDMAQCLRKLDSTSYHAPDNGILAGEKITPKHLNLVSLTQHEIDYLCANISANEKVDDGQNIEDIYPLAPLQEGMIYHHLLTKQANNKTRDPYITPLLLSFSSDELQTSFIEALNRLVMHHDVLRTSMHHQGLAQPVQVVHRSAKLLPLNLSLLGRDGTKDKQHIFNSLRGLEEWMAQHAWHFDLHIAPMMRLYSVPTNFDDRHYMILAKHHVMTDHIGLEAMMAQIMSLIDNPHQALTPCQPYRNFIARAKFGQNKTASKSYFSSLLRDFSCSRSAQNTLKVNLESTVTISANSLLNKEFSQFLNDSAHRCHIRPAALFHTVWSQVLSTLTQSTSSCIFGTLLSGRLQFSSNTTEEDQCSNDSLGLMINTLPVVLDVENDALAQVASMNAQLLQLVEFEHTALSDVSRWLDLGSAFFDGLINYRQSKSHTENNTSTDIQIHGGDIRTNYPLYFAVDDLGDQFNLSVQVDQSIASAEVVLHQLQDRLTQLVESLNNTSDKVIKTHNRNWQNHYRALTNLDGEAINKKNDNNKITADIVSIADSFEKQVAAIWQEVLACSITDRNMSFFDLGGHSLAAMNIMSRLYVIGIQAPIATLYESPILADFCQQLHPYRHGQQRDHLAASDDAVDNNLVTLKKSSEATAYDESFHQRLFVMHDTSGDVFRYQNLLDSLPDGCEVIGLDAFNLNAEHPALSSLASLAAHYVRQIKRIQPSGLYHLGGWSFGGKLALEIARQLLQKGDEVATISMIDSYAVREGKTEDTLPDLIGLLKLGKPPPLAV